MSRFSLFPLEPNSIEDLTIRLGRHGYDKPWHLVGSMKHALGPAAARAWLIAAVEQLDDRRRRGRGVRQLLDSLARTRRGHRFPPLIQRDLRGRMAIALARDPHDPGWKRLRAWLSGPGAPDDDRRDADEVSR
jgi:hypothetical protein